MSFYQSNSRTFMPFDIIYSDPSTSPFLSLSCHLYYVMFLNDHSKFVWSLSLSHKSKTFSTFFIFKTYIRTKFERDIIYNVIMAQNWIIDHFGISIKQIVFHFVFDVLIHHLKLVKLKHKFVWLITLFVPYWPVFPLLLCFGIMLCRWRLFF